MLLAGASGFLGTALRRELAASGHEVSQLVRGSATAADQLTWDPYQGRLDPAEVERADVVINLAGAPIAHWPWTKSYKQQILDSRVVTTRLLADAVANSASKPALVNASGVGYYGDRGDEVLDESSSPGAGFLAEVTQAWEGSTAPAREAGARVVALRTSVVLDGSGGALTVMKRPFLLGLGGRIGTGRQWFATISLADYVAAVSRLATDDALSGAFNVAAPSPATNAEFTRALGRQLHRPARLAVPAIALRAAAGELSGELLASARAVPSRLLEAGFGFQHPTVADQLRAALA